jgi:hypothetical protein
MSLANNTAMLMQICTVQPSHIGWRSGATSYTRQDINPGYQPPKLAGQAAEHCAVIGQHPTHTVHLYHAHHVQASARCSQRTSLQTPEATQLRSHCHPCTEAQAWPAHRQLLLRARLASGCAGNTSAARRTSWPHPLAQPALPQELANNSSNDSKGGGDSSSARSEPGLACTYGTTPCTQATDNNLAVASGKPLLCTAGSPTGLVLSQSNRSMRPDMLTVVVLGARAQRQQQVHTLPVASQPADNWKTGTSHDLNCQMDLPRHSLPNPNFLLLPAASTLAADQWGPTCRWAQLRNIHK